MIYRVISLLQPWASLVVAGYKTYETRSWKPSDKMIDAIFGKEILIHASLGATGEGAYKALQQEFGLHSLPEKFSELPRGFIIGKATFLSAETTEQWCAKHLFKVNRDEANWRQEVLMGDYSPGRFAWMLDNASQFKEPILTKGALSLWQFDMDRKIKL